MRSRVSLLWCAQQNDSSEFEDKRHEKVTREKSWTCMNLCGAHVVQVDNLQRNISKTWINYEQPTHNCRGTRIRYLHGVRLKSHHSAHIASIVSMYIVQGKWNGAFAHSSNFMIEPTQYARKRSHITRLIVERNDETADKLHNFLTHTTGQISISQSVANRLSFVCCSLHWSHNRVHSSGTYERIMYAIKRTRTIPISSIHSTHTA